MENQFILSEHFSSRDFILDVPFGKLTEHCLGDHGKLPIAAINIERGEKDEFPQRITKTSSKDVKCEKASSVEEQQSPCRRCCAKFQE